MKKLLTVMSLVLCVSFVFTGCSYFTIVPNVAEVEDAKSDSDKDDVVSTDVSSNTEEKQEQDEEEEEEEIVEVLNGNISLYLNGVEIEDAQAYAEDDLVTVDAEPVFNALGYGVYIGNEYISATDAYGYVSYSKNSEGKCIVSTQDKETETIFTVFDEMGCITLDSLIFAVDDLSYEVDYQNNEIYLETMMTAHKITTVSGSEELTAEDGTVIATLSYSYPHIECALGDDEEYIGQINEMFKQNAMEFRNILNEDFDDINEFYIEYSGYNSEYSFPTYMYEYSCYVNCDRMGVLSISEDRYYYTGGAHGGTLRCTHNYDLKNCTELELSDVILGTDEEITELFTEEFAKIPEHFFGDPRDVVPEEIENSEFYIDENGVTVYFQQYQVGSYASGFVSATVSDESVLKYPLKSKLSEYTFSLDGNPTTGYMWETVLCEDNISVESEYVSNADENSTMEGVGGVYDFTVKGIKQGNAILGLGYKRQNSECIEAYILKLYVHADNTVTIVDIIDGVDALEYLD